MQSIHMKISHLLLSAALVIGAGLASTPALAESNPAGDFVRGAKLWGQNCTRCHNVRDPRELRDDQWITITYHMRIRAGLTGQDTRDIIEFLQKSN